MFNATGQPALSLPLGWPDDGLPRGVQFVAAYGREDVLVRLGAAAGGGGTVVHAVADPRFADDGSARRTLQSVGIALDIIDALAEVPSSASASLPAGSASPRARPTARARCSPPRGCSTAPPTGATGSVSASSSTAAWRRSAPRSGDRGLPLLVELRNTLGETVQIGVPAGADVVYVERVEGRRALRYSTNARRSPIHRSSAGKVLAAFDPALLEARPRAGLPPSTGYTIVVPELLVEELARVRERGYARSVDETEIGMSSLAVPGARALSTVRWWRRSRWSARPRGWSATTRPTTRPCSRPAPASSARRSPG